MQACLLLLGLVTHSLATPNLSYIQCQEACLKGVLLTSCPKCSELSDVVGSQHPDYNQYEYEDDYDNSEELRMFPKYDTEDKYAYADDPLDDSNKRALEQYLDWEKRNSKKDDAVKGVFRWGKRARNLDRIYEDRKRDTADYDGPKVVFRWGKRSDTEALSPQKSVFRWGKRPDEEGYERANVMSYDTKPDSGVLTLYKDIIQGLATLRNYQDQGQEPTQINALHAEKRKGRSKSRNAKLAKLRLWRIRNRNRKEAAAGPKRGIFRWGKRTVQAAATKKRDTSDVIDSM